MKIVIYFASLFLICFCSCKMQVNYLQKSDVYFLSPDSPLAPRVCNEKESYIPDPNHLDHFPIKYVRVNFHFINTPDGTVSYNQEDGVIFAKYLLRHANYRMANNRKMTLPLHNETPILPTRIRYQLVGDASNEGIYFHTHPTLPFYNKKRNEYSLYSNEQYETFGVRKDDVLNIFLSEHHPDSIASPTYKASADGIGKTKWVKVAGAYQKYIELIAEGRESPHEEVAIVFAGLLNHEIGHSLGLRHSWTKNDGCDDTPQNPNCWSYTNDGSACDSLVSNNVMDYNSRRDSYSPCQIAVMHHKISKARSSQNKRTEPIWCTYDAEASITIPTGSHTQWMGRKHLAGDIIIENDASLTIYCDVHLPKNAKIVIAPRGKLTVHRAAITNICGEEWAGIEMHSTRSQRGSVIFHGEGRLLNCATGWQ